MLRVSPFRVVVVVSFLCTVGCALAPSPHQLDGYSFSQYVADFGKRYSDTEYAEREAVFNVRLDEIRKHNTEGRHSYVKGVNDMTDWSSQELAALNGARPRMSRLGKSGRASARFKTARQLPHSVDYRTAVPSVLTAVKNQGHCGSCWAHSAVEAIESHWAIATGKLHVLSQQQLTSCTPNPRNCGGTGGCAGAVESLAFDYVRDAGGVAEEWSYPYTSYYGQTGKCQNSSGAIAKVSGYVALPSNDQDALMEALAFHGPVAVSVDATYWSGYAGGIFDGCDYTRNITQNHAVQLVGYGTDPTTKQDYWIVRNSWGPRWGENGYMRLLRQRVPECGWDVDTHSGGACDGDPDTQWVCGMCGILSECTYPIVDTN